MLVELKAKNGSTMHNTTDVDSCQRAIRAIEIETYNMEHPMPKRELPPVDSLIIGLQIDRELRRERISLRLKDRLEEGMVDEIRGLLDSGIAVYTIQIMLINRNLCTFCIRVRKCNLSADTFLV